MWPESIARAGGELESSGWATQLCSTLEAEARCPEVSRKEPNVWS